MRQDYSTSNLSSKCIAFVMQIITRSALSSQIGEQSLTPCHKKGYSEYQMTLLHVQEQCLGKSEKVAWELD